MTTQSTDSLSSRSVVPLHGLAALPGEVREAAEQLRVSQYLPRVLEFTSEIFGGFSRVFVAEDPEIPGDRHIVFEVRVNASVEDALDKDEAWGKRLMETVPRAPRGFSLSLDFRP